MKCLWVGDAVMETGFARCTHRVCDVLSSRGHEISILGLNYMGDPHPHPYDIYPCFNPLQGGKDGFGIGRLPKLIESLNPDVVVILNDPWNIPAYMKEVRRYFDIPDDQPIVNQKPLPPFVGWLAVDGKNQKGKQIEDLTLAIPWTQFGADELKKGGYTGPLEIIPLGVDLNIYQPRDKQSSRAKWCPSELPPDAFIVGYVGRNQERKRLDLLIDYFTSWISQYNVDNAYLYISAGPSGDGAIDIKSLANYYGSRKRIIYLEPPIGTGISEIEMSELYSCFDTFMTCTQGEGWGLPIMEAMACQVPPIVPEWSALGEWPKHASAQIPCTSTALTSPGKRYTVGGVPDKKKTIEALSALYYSKGLRLSLGHTAHGLVSQPQFRWEHIALEMERCLLNTINERLD